MASSPRPATIKRLSKFNNCLNGLPEHIRKGALKKLKAIEKDWPDSWADPKPMVGYDDLWRFKITGKYRMVAKKEKNKDVFIFEWAGTKNDFKVKY